MEQATNRFPEKKTKNKFQEKLNSEPLKIHERVSIDILIDR